MQDDDYLKYIPDARDGLTRLERIVLYCLYELQKELGPHRGVPSIMLYGRVLEHIDASEDAVQAVLSRHGQS